MKCPICDKEAVFVGYKDASTKLYRCKEHGVIDVIEDEWYVFLRDNSVKILAGLVSNHAITEKLLEGGVQPEMLPKMLSELAIDYTETLINYLKNGMSYDKFCFESGNTYKRCYKALSRCS